MKKIITMALAALAAVSMVSAFDFNAGLRGSFGYGLGRTFSNSDYNKDAYKVSFPENIIWDIGAVAEIQVNKTLGLQAEINYANNNVGYNYSDSYSSVTPKYTWSSVEIPLLVTVNMRAGSGYAKAYAGPHFTFPTGNLKTSGTAKVTVGGTGGSKELEGEADITSSILAGLTFGGDYLLKMGTGNLSLGLRYSLDFMPLKAKASSSSDANDVYTRRGLKINAGYVIPFSL